MKSEFCCRRAVVVHVLNIRKFVVCRVFGFFNGMSITFIVKDVEIIKQITIRDFDNFINHNKSFDEKVDPIAGRALVSMFDEKWRVMRNSLSPVFTSSKMKMMFGTLCECAQSFINYFDEERGRIIIDAKEIFNRFTFDGISTAVLGIEGDCIKNKDSSLYRIGKSAVSPSFWSGMKMVLVLICKPLYLLLKLRFLSEEMVSFLEKHIIDAMNNREKHDLYRADIIQILLQIKKGQLQKNEQLDETGLAIFAANIEYDVGVKKAEINWTKEDLLAQGLIFFTAGADTTKNLLQMTAYELAKNPAVQKELIEEVDCVLKTLGDEPVTYEALHKMKYLDQVISESLRYWPPAFVTNRECNKDYLFDLGNGKTALIKKGEQVLIPIAAIQRDPKYFADPNTFDPHRFDDDRKNLILPGSFIPFGKLDFEFWC